MIDVPPETRHPQAVPARGSNSRAIAVTCSMCGGATGFMNLMVSKRAGGIVLDPHEVTDPTDSDDACPGCRGTIDVQRITGTSPRVQAWACAACRTNWAVTIVNPSPQPFFDRLAATVEQLAACSVLRQVITLADDAPGLTDRELWARLLVLAESAR